MRRCAQRARRAAQVACGVSYRGQAQGLQRRRAVRQASAASVAAGFGSVEFDTEGRYLEADFGAFDRHQRVSAVGVERAGIGRLANSAFSPSFFRILLRLRDAGREVILCGDWNIAHQPIDLKNWRSNQKNSGFLPEERAWLTRVFDELGFVDVFRRVNQRPEQYTWWSNRGQAWAKNVGWRIDYQIATPGIAAKARAAAIYINRRFSDHAPLIIDYDYDLTDR